MIGRKLVQIVADGAAALAVIAIPLTRRDLARDTIFAMDLVSAAGLGMGSLGCDNCGGERRRLSAEPVSRWHALTEVAGRRRYLGLVERGPGRPRDRRNIRRARAVLPLYDGGFFLTGGIGALSMRGEFGEAQRHRDGKSARFSDFGGNIVPPSDASVTPRTRMGFAMRKNENATRTWDRRESP